MLNTAWTPIESMCECPQGPFCQKAAQVSHWCVLAGSRLTPTCAQVWVQWPRSPEGFLEGQVLTLADREFLAGHRFPVTKERGHQCACERNCQHPGRNCSTHVAVAVVTYGCEWIQVCKGKFSFLPLRGGCLPVWQLIDLEYTKSIIYILFSLCDVFSLKFSYGPGISLLPTWIQLLLER